VPNNVAACEGETITVTVDGNAGWTLVGDERSDGAGNPLSFNIGGNEDDTGFTFQLPTADVARDEVYDIEVTAFVSGVPIGTSTAPQTLRVKDRGDN
jgi:hypothetical protein